MQVIDRQLMVRGGAALSIGLLAGVSRLVASIPPLVVSTGVVAGVIVGVGVHSHERVYHHAIAAAAGGTLLYVVTLTVGAQAGVYSMPGSESKGGFDAIGPLLEPLLFFPLLVVETLVVAVVVKRLRIWVVGDDTIEFS